MFSRLRSSLASLVFLKEEEARATARFVSCLLPVCVGVALVLTTTPLSPGTPVQRLEVGLPLILVSSWSWVLLRRGRLRLASLVFILGAWAVFTSLTITRDGVRSPAFVANLVLVVYAAFLVTPAAALAVFLISMLAGLGLVLAAVTGRLPVPSVVHTPITLYANYTSLMLLVVLIVLAITKDYRDLFMRLRSNEERFRALVEATSDWIWEVDTQSVYTYASPKVKELLGYEPEELIGRRPFDLMPPKEAARQEETMRRYFEQAQPFTHVVSTNRHRDGHLVTLDTSGVPVFDAEGVLRGYRGIDRDITEQKRAEEVLQESEARYRRFMHMSMEGIWRLETDPPVSIHLEEEEQAALILERARVVECNNVMARRYGFSSPEEIIGLRFDDLWNIDREGKLEYILHFIRSGYRVDNMESNARYPDGSKAWFLNSTIGLIEDDYLHSAWSTYIDITARKQSEEALREREANYRSLFDVVPVSVTLHQERKVVLVNRASTKMFAVRDVGELIGTEVVRYIAEGERAQVEERLRSLSRGSPEAPEHYFTTLRRVDGEEFPAEVFATDIVYRGRPATQVVIIDITERVRMQQALLESESRLRALFAAMTDLILVLDAEGRYLEIAPTKPGLLYRPVEQLLGRTVHEVFPPAQADLFRDHITRALETGDTLHVTYTLDLQGRELHFAAALSPLSEGTVLAVIRDITEVAEQQARALTAERARAVLAEHLNDEINHRARNNLAMVSGLLQVQASHEPEPRVAAALREAVARIRTFVDIHEKIYATGAQEVDLLDILGQVAATLRGIFAGTGVEISVEGVSGLFPTQAVTNLAVMTNELVTNALKHGGPASDGFLHVRVRVTRSDGHLRLSVWNSGNSVAEDFDIAAHPGMGLRLIAGMMARYGGSLQLRPAEGGTQAETVVQEHLLAE